MLMKLEAKSSFGSDEIQYTYQNDKLYNGDYKCNVHFKKRLNLQHENSIENSVLSTPYRIKFEFLHNQKTQ